MLLGLIPSSERAWPAAVGLLRDTGGMLHIHGNVSEEDIQPASDTWQEAVVHRIRMLAREQSRPWAEDVRAVYLSRVKTYAPFVMHCVLDVQCGGK